MERLNWRIEGERIAFGSLMPFAGNTYELVISDDGHEPPRQFDIYLMDDRGEKILAVSKDGKLSLTSIDLRGQFRKVPHEYIGIHVYARYGGATVADGDMFVAWNPLWSDGEPGPAYTIKGPPGDSVKGDKGDDGLSAYEIAVKYDGFVGTQKEWLDSLKGPPGTMTSIRNPETGKWHRISAVATPDGTTIQVDDTGSDGTENDHAFVDLNSDQTIAGKKTFTSPVRCNVQSIPDESAGYLVTAPYVSGKIDEKLSSVDSFSRPVTFSAGAIFSQPIEIAGGRISGGQSQEDDAIASMGALRSVSDNLQKKIKELSDSLESSDKMSSWDLAFISSSRSKSVLIPGVERRRTIRILILWYSVNSSYSLTLEVAGSSKTVRDKGFHSISQTHIVESGEELRINVTVSSSSINSASVIAWGV